jgi:hypothetical protein
MMLYEVSHDQPIIFISYLAFLVSSATCPAASKPVKTPEEKRLDIVRSDSIRHVIVTYKDRIQFHTGGAPVPLSDRGISTPQYGFRLMDVQVVMKASWVERSPYVFDALIGNQVMHKKKSNIIRARENLKTLEYHFAGNQSVHDPIKRINTYEASGLAR